MDFIFGSPLGPRQGAPVEAEGGTSVAASAGWLFWNLMAHPLFGKEDSISPPRWLWTAVHIAVHEEDESLPNTRRSRPNLNDNPSLCATLYTVGGVGELNQRQSILL
jgi:hypothetical protein